MSKRFGPTDDAGTSALRLTGNALANTVIGNAGNNVLDGGAGVDVMAGGAGNDRFMIDNAADQIVEAAGGGGDTALTCVSYTLGVGVSVEAIRAANAASTSAFDLTGNEYAQTLSGNAGVNVLNGGGGNDYILGYEGGDTLIGGLGADNLVGGVGDDMFRYFSTAESTAAASDRIFDFAAGDHIALSGIDAVFDTGANDAFAFIGATAFSGLAGELRAFDNGNGSWTVQADVDRNHIADFQLLVTPASRDQIVAKI